MLRRVIPDVVRDQHLLALPRTAAVQDAARRMTERRVRSVLIVDGERLAGIFTGTDLIERVVAEGRDPVTTELGRVMTVNPLSIPPDHLAIEALRVMHGGGFRHLPVVDGHRLVGIVSRRDFIADEEEELKRERLLWERL